MTDRSVGLSMASDTDDDNKLVINEDEIEIEQEWNQVGGAGIRREHKRMHSGGGDK